MNTPKPKGKRGPKTPEGKKRSSMNALKHGLTATSPQAFELLSTETGVSYQDTLEEIRQHYLPQDPVEEQLVRRIARCVWRLSVSEEMEERQFMRNPMPGKPGVSYERIMKFESKVDIHLHRAMQMLTAKREAERAK